VLDENSKYISNLIERSKKKNLRSFIQIVQLYTDGVFSFVNRLLCNQQLATQVSIEVFRFAWDNIQQVRMNSSLIAWLQGVALVNILEKYRAKQEDVRNATPVNKININMKLSEIDVLLSLLTFEERLVIVLYDIKKYTLDEIQGLLPEFSLREVRAYLDQGRLKISNGFRR